LWSQCKIYGKQRREKESYVLLDIEAERQPESENRETLKQLWRNSNPLVSVFSCLGPRFLQLYSYSSPSKGPRDESREDGICPKKSILLPRIIPVKV
jgi:hypothetical protein